jgi:hypothetical protein
VRIGFLPIDLARWDQAEAGDLLAVGLWSDVRPLRGAAGLLDWRLDGRLSSLIVAGHLTGAEGEQLLVPVGHRLAWRFALAAGLGAAATFSERRFVDVVNRTLATMRGLKLARLAVALPGRDGDRIRAPRAFQLFMKEAEETLPGIVEQVTIIEPVAAQKEIGELMRKRKSVRTDAR